MDNKNSIEQLYAYVKDCYDGEIRCRVFEDRVVVATTIFLEGYDESVCNAFCFSPDGRVIINDGGSVADYREVIYADDKFDTDEIKKLWRITTSNSTANTSPPSAILTPPA